MFFSASSSLQNQADPFDDAYLSEDEFFNDDELEDDPDDSDESVPKSKAVFHVLEYIFMIYPLYKSSYEFGAKSVYPLL